MPYIIGSKGSHDCSGFPVVKEATSEVMGCHKDFESAVKQIAALDASEDKSYEEKDTVTNGGGIGIKNPEEWPKMNKALPDAYRPALESNVPEGRACGNCVFYNEKNIQGDMAFCEKWDEYVRGDYYCDAWAPQEEVSKQEDVSKACWDGYTQRGMKPGRNGGMVPNCVPVSKMDDLFEDADDVEYEDGMSKAESFSPTDAMKSAARRALKWKADGKATGAGTPVGWGRATDIVAGRSMSLSTVKRMFSFFSRHEAASKGGKDFNNTSNPSNGRIMWDAWGGNAGFTWSRTIVNRMKDKAMFANFGKDYTRSTSMLDIFKSIGVGSMVSWNSSGGRARGKITRIIRNGSYKVPGTSVTVSGTKEDPAAVIRLYRDGEPTDTIVAHKIKTLRAA